MPGAANFQAKQTREGVPPSQLIFPPKNEGEYIRATQARQKVFESSQFFKNNFGQGQLRSSKEIPADLRAKMDAAGDQARKGASVVSAVEDTDITTPASTSATKSGPARARFPSGKRVLKHNVRRG